MRLALCSRSGDVLEPRLKPQWYVRIKSMAEEAARLVREGEMEIQRQVKSRAEEAIGDDEDEEEADKTNGGSEGVWIRRRSGHRRKVMPSRPPYEKPTQTFPSSALNFFDSDTSTIANKDQDERLYQADEQRVGTRCPSTTDALPNVPPIAAFRLQSHGNSPFLAPTSTPPTVPSTNHFSACKRPHLAAVSLTPKELLPRRNQLVAQGPLAQRYAPANSSLGELVSTADSTQIIDSMREQLSLLALVSFFGKQFQRVRDEFVGQQATPLKQAARPSFCLLLVWAGTTFWNDVNTTRSCADKEAPLQALETEAEEEPNLPSTPHKRKKTSPDDRPSAASSASGQQQQADSVCLIEERLPDEVLRLVLGFLPKHSIGCAARTCRRWFRCSPEHLRHKLPGRTQFSRLELVKWGEANGFTLFVNPWFVERTACVFAAELGGTDVLEYLLEHIKKKPTKGMATGAARYGQLATLKWLKEHGSPWSADACTAAARNGHLEALKWLSANDCPWNSEACASAARGGHLEVLKWLRQNRCQWSVKTCAKAARGGHLEVLQWARGKGCSWNKKTCAAAAKGGHLKVLQWARGQGCEWDKETFVNAAANGHLHVLQWTDANSCPHGPEDLKKARIEAIFHGHVDVLDWLWKNKGIWTLESHSRTAVAAGHVNVLEWMKEHGCPFDDPIFCVDAASDNRLDALKWLRANECPWDVETTKMAADKGYLELLRWAHENGCTWNKSVVTIAVGCRDWPMVKWLLRNGCPFSKAYVSQNTRGFRDAELEEILEDLGIYSW
ncbi:valine--tRNA ligase [Balamuthia mandrillaris]